MPRRPRFDEPDCWLHIMNRGLARRTAFETRAHVRYLLACLARSVRRGEIEVHSFCVLPTHYHLLVRSPRAVVSVAMQRMQNDYVRWFNRRHKRDGSLFRGRFQSVPVRSEAHMLNLIRYIDQNAVEARVVRNAADYPYGSAFYYRHRKGPPWLTRSRLERAACEAAGAPDFSIDAYDTCFGTTLSAASCALVEGRIQRGLVTDDHLDDLVGAAPERVYRWMTRRAALADGTKPGPLLVVPDVVHACLADRSSRNARWTGKLGRSTYDLYQVAHVAILREASGASWAEIRSRLPFSAATARRYYRIHRNLLTTDPSYAQRVSALLAHAIALQFDDDAEPR